MVRSTAIPSTQSPLLAAVTVSLCQLYLADPRPWMVGFSGGKDSILVAYLIFDAVRSIPVDDRTEEIHFLRTDTRMEIPRRRRNLQGHARQDAGRFRGVGPSHHHPPASPARRPVLLV